MLPHILFRGLLLGLFGLVAAQDGGISGPQTSPEAAGYSCDPNSCKLPDCNCASTDPPGGLDPDDVPMFVVFTADDAIQSYTLDAVNQFLAHRKNPNGCQPKMTYYVSTNYTNYTLVTDWYVAGNEIADHTMTHVGSPPADEIHGNLIALNALAGIPMSSISGFRAPFLQYTAETLKLLHKAGFTYDSSASASIPVTDPHTDAYWPYTLDNGMANGCLAVPGTCKGEPKLPGFWEVPMYSFFDRRGGAGPHLMDPWLDYANGGTKLDNNATLDYMRNTFTDHYNGKRQPIGLYTHPIHVSPSYVAAPGDPQMIAMINTFLDWAQDHPNTWIVSTEQLLDWVRHPVPASQLNQLASLQCTPPAIDAKICNGMPQNEAGLINHCTFSDAPFYTCYGCPATQPMPSNPNPEQDTSKETRLRLPANCSTPFWDPVKGECLCTSSSCAFNDVLRPIGLNGENYVPGGAGGSMDSKPKPTDTPYIPFSGGNPLFVPSTTVLVGVFSVLVGAMGMARL